jgi:tryptophan synthase alpha chain
MTRYATIFERAGGRGLFGAFAMLGYPDRQASLDILSTLVAAGADMIEVGIPFSDPVADGPTIQAAAEQALRNGVTPAQCFDILAEFRSANPGIPIGVLTYANIVVARGRDDFYRRCAAAAVDSVLVADVPAMEAAPFAATAREHGIAPVLIAAPNTPRPTLERIARLGGGYTYCVARAGVTGSEREMTLNHETLFEALADYGAPPPVLGFGISTPGHVRAAIEAGAAGVIAGSAIVKLIDGEVDSLDRISRFVAEMKAACSHPSPSIPAAAAGVSP